jgi:hypothetical protein
LLILFLAFLGGVLTIVSPGIVAVLPFVFASTGRPFRCHDLNETLATVGLDAEGTLRVRQAAIARQPEQLGNGVPKQPSDAPLMALSCGDICFGSKAGRTSGLILRR